MTFIKNNLSGGLVTNAHLVPHAQSFATNASRRAAVCSISVILRKSIFAIHSNKCSSGHLGR